MELLYVFPHLNAILNATSAVFLIAGFCFIMTTQVARHRACMLTASSISALFLVSYVTHHSLRTYYFGLGPTRFMGTGLARPIYFTVLTSHTILAAGVAPFVVLTLWRALKCKFDAHRRVARIVYPIWLYVSLTGVIVYVMLYHLYRSN
jgi:putative membrane protein